MCALKPCGNTVVCEADRPLLESKEAPEIEARVSPTVTGRFEIDADLSTRRFSEVRFAVKAGDGGYRPVGTDDNAPFRVFRVADNYATGTRLTVKAIVDDPNGHLRSETVRTTVGD